MSDRYSRLFAEYVQAIDYDGLPQDTVHQVKRRVVDAIGVAMAAFSEDAPRAVRSYAVDLADVGNATLWGTPISVPPDVAALSNGVAVRYLDFNDTYLSREPLHPSDMIPGLMALCQWGDRPLRDLVAAIAIGYEVAVNLCDAASLRAHGWDHVNYIAIGEACGAGKLLGMTTEQMENAIAIATVPHAAMRQTRAGELSMWKGAAAANAARNAIVAALLARQGFTGPYRPFDGEMGFFKQLLGGEAFDDAPLRPLERRETPTRIQDTYIKFWPVEYHAQSAVDAALQLRQQVDDPSAIEGVHLDTFKAAYEIIAKDPEKWEPRTRETADHSIQYIVCAALLDGRVTKESFRQERIVASDVRSLLKRMTLKEDDTLTMGYPDGIPNRISVTTRDGRTLTREVSHPRGHPKNPMSDEELVEKFHANVEWCWTPPQAQLVLDLIWDLDGLNSLNPLMESIRV